MTIEVLRTKIDRVRVTEVNLHNIGSITIDEGLFDAVGLVEGEKVQVLDVDKGERLKTNVIEAQRGSGVICLNGSARKVQVVHLVVIIPCARTTLDETRVFRPGIIFPDERINLLRS